MGPIANRRIAVCSEEARCKERVKTWPNKSPAESSDSASTEDSLWDSSEDGSYRRSKHSFLEDDEVEPKQEKLSDEPPSAGTAPPSRAPSPHEDEDTAKLVKSKPDEKDVATHLSSDGAKAGSLQGHGPAMESATSSRDITNMGCETSSARRRSFGCTSCGEELFSVREVQEHPDLGVGMCRACYSFLFSSPYTKDAVDCSEEQCRWCGQGGRIVMCDHCDKSFCEACIVRNFGPRGLALVVSDSSWRCFFCNPDPLRASINELNEFQHLAIPQHPQPNFSEANFPVRRKGASWRGELISRGASADASDIILRTEGEGPTIAELLAQEMERRRQNKGMWTNSLRLKTTTQKTCRAYRKRKLPASTFDPGLHFEVQHPGTGGVTKQELPHIDKQVAPATEVIKKQLELPDIETQAAPPLATLPRIWIRPHQWIRKRQEAAERRKRAEEAEDEAQRLKNVTNLPNDGPKQNANSGVEAESQLPESHCNDNKGGDADQKLPREIIANSKPGIQVVGN